MRASFFDLAFTVLVADIAAALPMWPGHTPPPETGYYVSLGPRPFYIINNMTESPVKDKLETCENGPFSITGFTFGHRGGGTLQFPEETVESTMAGAKMGAGVLECDVSFTKDRGLVCRHSLCDLHTTTNILTKPELAAKCTVPFTPANATSPANALCCTTDITTAEYMTLCGKQDGFNASAKTPQDCELSLGRLVYDHHCDIPISMLKIFFMPFQKLQVLQLKFSYFIAKVNAQVQVSATNHTR
jgi:glycerophosphoryl diester phosphodiesterase